MNYSLISIMIFQDLLKKNINCITSTSQLKMYIIAFLVEGSYVYSDNDVDQLVNGVMRFLTVEDTISQTTNVAVEVNNLPLILSTSSFKEKIKSLVEEIASIVSEYDDDELVDMSNYDMDIDDILINIENLKEILDLES